MTTEMSMRYNNELNLAGIEEGFKWFNFVHLDLTQQVKQIPKEIFQNIELKDEEEDFIIVDPK